MKSTMTDLEICWYPVPPLQFPHRTAMRSTSINLQVSARAVVFAQTNVVSRSVSAAPVVRSAHDSFGGLLLMEEILHHLKSLKCKELQ